MTATTRLIEDYAYEPSRTEDTPLFVAHEILRRVRVPEAIFLQDIACAVEAGSGVGAFLCPRSRQFPNPNVTELTGGQLIDSATQMAYCLTGLMIYDGVDVLGLDFEDFKQAINTHRIHAIRTEITFRRPCRFDRSFRISANLHRFANGAFCVRRRHPLRYFVRIALEGTQPARDQGAETRSIFQARIAACHRAR